MALIFSNIPELDGTNTEIALANLSSLESELSNIFERRIAHLSELVHAIINDGGDIDLIKSIILSIRSDGGLLDYDICPENIPDMTEMFSKLSVIERVLIFKRVFELISAEKYHFLESVCDISPDAKGRIAYMRNSYNDTAFEKFSNILRDTKASYYSTVADVCESVVADKCQYCILPVETAKDGKLISFYNTIIKNRLKINAEFELKDISQNGYIKYALLGKTSMLPRGQLIVEKRQSYLEILYSDTDNISLGELIIAAEYFGLKVQAVDTFTVNCLSKKQQFSIVFSASDEGAKMFMTYLAVDCPDHVLMGFFQYFNCI